MKKLFRNPLTILILYSLLTIFLTFPWITEFTTHKLGDDIDGSMLIWNIWWVKKALTSSAHSLLFSDYIFYPIGSSLTFHTLTILNGIIALPFCIFTDNIILIFNILTFLTFVLAGFGTYLLVDYLIDDKLAAFSSGIVFAFCSFHFVKVSFINYMSIQWLPFYILFLIKSLEEKSKFLNVFFAGIFLLFNTLVCEIYGLFAGLFTIAYLVYYLIVKKDYTLRKNAIIKSLAIFSIFILFFSPILYSMFKDLVSNSNNILKSTLENARSESADFLSYLIPGPLHPFWGNHSFNLTKHFSGLFQETVMFPGYTVLVLTLFSFFKTKKESFIKFWVLMLLISTILTFGPFLHINGREHFLSSQISIPMPYLLTYYIPFLSAVRIPGRYGVMAMLFFAVLSGYSLKSLFSKTKKYSLLWKTAIIFIILFEYLPLPFPLISDMKIPSVYERIKNEPGDYAILNVPLGWRAKGTYHLGYNLTRFQYYQTFHGKRILDGMLARTSQKNSDYFSGIPIIKSIISLEYDKPLAPETIERDRKVVDEFLDFFNIRYIILDEVYERIFTHLNKNSLENTDNYIKEVFPVKLLFENNNENRLKIEKAFKNYKDYLESISPPREDPFFKEITSLDTTFKVYEVQRKDSPEIIKVDPREEISNLYLAKGWSKVNNKESSKPYIRPVKKNPLLLIYFNGVKDRKMIFKASLFDSFNGSGFKLSVDLNNKKIADILITRGWNIYSVKLPSGSQNKGINKIEFLMSENFNYENIPAGFNFFEIREDK